MLVCQSQRIIAVNAIVIIIINSGQCPDYEAVINQTLILSSTETVITVPVTIKDDIITESIETFISLLSLQSQLNNVTIQPRTAQVTLLDNDAGEIS